MIVCLGKAIPTRIVFSTRKLLYRKEAHLVNLLTGPLTLPFIARNPATLVECSSPIISVKKQVHLVPSFGIMYSTEGERDLVSSLFVGRG